MSYAFITLLSSGNYLNAVIALKRSLKRVQSKYPLVVMVTKDLATDFSIMHELQKEQVIIEIIPNYYYTNNIQEKYANYAVLNTASKIHLFTLKHYDKLVYLDADMAFVKNADELFNYPDGAILKCDIIGSGGVSGLFVIIPKMHTEFKFLEYLIQNVDCFDGDLFDALWFHVKTNRNYQIPMFIYCFNIGENSTIPEQTKIIHLGHERSWWWNKQYNPQGEAQKYYYSLLN